MMGHSYEGGVMRILSGRMVGEHGCTLSVSFSGAIYELVARRIRRHEGMAVVGAFEPANFHSLPLSAFQVRALVRTAVELSEGSPHLLPIDVPAEPPTP